MAWSAAIIGIALHGAAFAAPPVYRVVALPTAIPELKDAAIVVVGDINNAGDVVGQLKDASAAAAAVYWDGATHAISALKTDISSPAVAAVRINDKKVITGWNYGKAVTVIYPIAWDSPWSAATRLQMLDKKARRAIPVDINSFGVMVGPTIYKPKLTESKATMWFPDGSAIDLGFLPGAEHGTVPSAINDSGVVVGSAVMLPFGFTHPFMWTTDSGIVDLGVVPVTDCTLARDINNNNQVVLSAGSCDQPSATRSYLWTGAAGYVDLGLLPHSQDSDSVNPVRLNNSGAVVGSFRDLPSGTSQVFYWTAQTGMVDLRTLIDPNDPLKAMLAARNANLYIGGLNDQGAISASYSIKPTRGEPTYGAIVLVPAN